MVVGKNFFSSLSVEFRQHKWSLTKAAVAFYGVTWLAINSSSFYDANVKAQLATPEVQLIAIVVSLIAGGFVAYPTRTVSFSLKNTDTTVTVRFGDLFSEPGFKVIAVGEFFDSELGDLVSPSSVHGKLITKHFGGHPHAFDALVTASLQGVPSTPVERARGNKSKFPIGTTALIKTNEDSWYLVALCHTDLKTHKASATAAMLYEALAGLWIKVRNTANNQRVTLPLIGSGPSGVGLPPMSLLTNIITSLLDAAKKQKVTSEVHIVLHDSYFHEIDLKQVKRNWS